MHAPGYEFTIASTDDELRQILAIQAANMRDHLAPEDLRSQGFLTLRHDLALLREMNNPWPHVIAKSAGTGRIAAYALVMQTSWRARIPKLGPMFRELEALEYEGVPLSNVRWYVMGQVCVAREHRGRGLVEGLYAEHRARMAGEFELMVTEIDAENSRSIRVHERAGCRRLHQYRSESGRDWIIVALDLRAMPAP